MTDSLPRPDSSVRESAAEWYWTIREPDVSDAELAEWQEWMSASPEHRLAFQQAKQAMDAVAMVESLPWPTERDLLRDSYDGSLPVRTWLQTKGDRRRASKGPAARRPQFRVPIRLPSPALALAAALAAVAVGLTMFLSLSKAPTGVSETATYQTVAAEHRDVMLPDGSSISLAAGTAVSVTYNADARLVDLTAGEAFFDVAEDSSRPFEVVANGRRMIAVGTAFNVARQAGRVTLTVTEGTVAVERSVDPGSRGGAGFARVVAGHQVSFDQDAVEAVLAADTADALAWRSGMLRYRGEPLRFVIEDVNRYTRLPVVVADEQAAAQTFTGTVFQDSAETWVDGLEDALPVRLERTASGIRIYSRP